MSSPPRPSREFVARERRERVAALGAGQRVGPFGALAKNAGRQLCVRRGRDGDLGRGIGRDTRGEKLHLVEIVAPGERVELEVLVAHLDAPGDHRIAEIPAGEGHLVAAGGERHLVTARRPRGGGECARLACGADRDAAHALADVVIGVPVRVGDHHAQKLGQGRAAVADHLGDHDRADAGRGVGLFGRGDADLGPVAAHDGVPMTRGLLDAAFGRAAPVDEEARMHVDVRAAVAVDVLAHAADAGPVPPGVAGLERAVSRTRASGTGMGLLVARDLVVGLHPGGLGEVLVPCQRRDRIERGELAVEKGEIDAEPLSVRPERTTRPDGGRDVGVDGGMCRRIEDQAVEFPCRVDASPVDEFEKRLFKCIGRRHGRTPRKWRGRRNGPHKKDNLMPYLAVIVAL